MAYFLRKDHKKKGIYLQMYESYWDKDKKQPRNKCIESFGYVHELENEEMPDPIAYFTDYVKQRNLEREALTHDETRPRIFADHIEKNAGYFLLHSLLEELGVEEDIQLLATGKQFQFSLYHLICQLIYARVICPCSKSKTVSRVFPLLYRHEKMSEDQVYDGLFYIGLQYDKFIELFNRYYERLFPRRLDHVYFDCTNYYFEIDKPADDKQKGPSKENRYDPIIGQALLLDADLVPVAMEMYPGNESEKPYIRKVIDKMKARHKVEGRTIQVADKGLNCARNIHAAVVEGNDGYIFSKSIYGRNLSKKEKAWLLLENEDHIFTDYKDSTGKLLYRLKSVVDDFDYSFKEVDEQTGEEKTIHFSVKEKRVVSFNPDLAQKQRKEILRMVDKAMNNISLKDHLKQEIGDAAKYVSIVTVDEQGKKIKPQYRRNQEKIEEDLALASYNLLVTSEINMEANDIYRAYHKLWKIEESFRLTKSELDARPVFLQRRESIYGHFLICYLSLFLLRVLEIKCFDNKVSAFHLIRFIRDFRLVHREDGEYINISSDRQANEIIKKLTGLTNLDALYLSKKEIDKLFDHTMLIP